MPPAASTAATTSPNSWRPLGRYELGPRLATGGMAELYLARTAEVHGFRKYLAVKRILPRWADDHEFVEMFLDEARLAAQLDHPNVVHVYDIGEDGDGFYFTMDYIHGKDLVAIMRRAKQRGASLPWAAFVALGSAAAAGLHHAHGRRGFDGQPLGIIHRDVSPTNILVSYEGAVKLVDFGIAKASTSRHSTRPSVRKGKMAYMSPEQCRGDALDQRSDVFALGVVLYELATLRRAFDGDGEFAAMNQIVNHDLPPARERRADIPEAIERVIMRAVARDPQARPSTARELQRGLEAFAVEAGLMATPETLATMMEDLFGTAPYPWETPDAVDDAMSSATRVQAADREDTGATVARPMPAASASDATARSHRRRATWWIGGLVAAGAASIAWFAARPDTTPSAAAGPAASVDAEPTRTDVERPSTAPSPAASEPPGTATPIVVPPPSEPTRQPEAATPEAATPEAATPVAPTPPRRTKTPRAPPSEPASAPSSAALPAPFDPDAPAPRVR